MSNFKAVAFLLSGSLFAVVFSLFLLSKQQNGFAQTELQAGSPVSSESASLNWTQWRGPNRNGKIPANALPVSLKPEELRESWRVPLGPSYSGPIIVDDRVFVTETRNRKTEVVSALDRKSGEKIWTTQWEGAMNVPFFAASNGSWIRSTPAFDEGKLYVAGMRDLFVCLDAATGKQIWKVDFPAQTGSPLPSFGFVCSPLVDGRYVYVQAGGAFTKLDKTTGNIVWQSLNDGGGMNGSAFSSPIIATLAGKRQAVVLSRTRLSGVDLDSGKEIWSQPIQAFRGMNILTPTLVGDNVFTSTYGGTTELFKVSTTGGAFTSSSVWKLPAQGYMSSPVIIDGHAYVHLRNQRFACFDLAEGVEKWRSKPFGKYASLVASGDRILALDQKGELLLMRANPEKFELIDRRKVGNDSWAHVAVSDNNIVVRSIDEVIMYEWK